MILLPLCRRPLLLCSSHLHRRISRTGEMRAWNAAGCLSAEGDSPPALRAKVCGRARRGSMRVCSPSAAAARNCRPRECEWRETNQKSATRCRRGQRLWGSLQVDPREVLLSRVFSREVERLQGFAWRMVPENSRAREGLSRVEEGATDWCGAPGSLRRIRARAAVSRGSPEEAQRTLSGRTLQGHLLHAASGQAFCTPRLSERAGQTVAQRPELGGRTTSPAVGHDGHVPAFARGLGPAESEGETGRSQQPPAPAPRALAGW